jgi:hypothetical protein
VNPEDPKKDASVSYSADRGEYRSVNSAGVRKRLNVGELGLLRF